MKSLSLTMSHEVSLQLELILLCTSLSHITGPPATLLLPTETPSLNRAEIQSKVDTRPNSLDTELLAYHGVWWKITLRDFIESGATGDSIGLTAYRIWIQELWLASPGNRFWLWNSIWKSGFIILGRPVFSSNKRMILPSDHGFMVLLTLQQLY